MRASLRVRTFGYRIAFLLAIFSSYRLLICVHTYFNKYSLLYSKSLDFCINTNTFPHYRAAVTLGMVGNTAFPTPGMKYYLGILRLKSRLISR